MHHIDFSLPLSNPILIFSLVLFIILIAPIVLNRLKIPPIIGLILAGAAVGPNGFNLMLRDESIQLFGIVGLMYIMFLAGLEIDMADFKKNKYKSLLFGMFTFLIPMVIGTSVSVYLLDFPLNSSILLASMFASHTLISYPIVSRYGIIKNKAVNITVGGTVITDTLALLVLAVIVGMAGGEVDSEFWIRLVASLAVFVAIVLLFFPRVARWFFIREQDSVSQYIFVLAVVFLSAFMAEAAGVEGIIGAFLAGMALNSLIPHTSALMNRINFVGNALFIPFFLIGVGMLIDFGVFTSGARALTVAAVMTGCATLAKFIAAYFTKLTLKFSRYEFLLMFGLSNAQAAATLAAVLVGYNVVLDPETGTRLLNEDVLNGTIIMILVTCTISSLVVGRSAAKIAMLESQDDELDEDGEEVVTDKFLLPVSETVNIDEMVSFSSMFVRNKKKTKFFALYVDVNEGQSKKGDKLIEKVEKTTSGIELNTVGLKRHDINVSNGIINVIKENGITDVFLGMHEKHNFIDTYYGNVLSTVIEKTDNNLFIYRSHQPISTIKKIVVVVPEKAEFETGFIKWVQKIHLLSKEINSQILFYTNSQTQKRIEKILNALEHNIPVSFKILDEWEDFLIISRDLKKEDLLIIVTARKNTLSYNRLFDKIPKQLSKYFEEQNVIVLFPQQYNEKELERRRMDGSMEDLLEENLKIIDNIGKYFKNILRK